MTARLLHFSDVENAYDDPDRIARLVATVRERRDGDTLVCDTGDTLAPSMLSMETDGDHVRPFYDAVDADVGTVGNHDFDPGMDVLRNVLARSSRTWVTTNLLGPDGDRPLGAALGVRRTATASVGGRRVGFLGLTAPDLVREHGHAEDVTVADPIPVAREAVADLRERGVDDVVVLSHLGRGDERLAEAVDVDVILGGHTHDTAAGVLGGAVHTRPGARGRRLAEVSLGGGFPTLHDVTDRPVADDVAAEYHALFAEAGLDERVATVDRPLDRGPADCYPESRAGNAVADAYRWVGNADVAVCNAKMLRAGPPIAGSVTLGDLRSLTPFENEVWTARLTGEELLTLFGNLTAEAVGFGGPELFAHVSGARLRWRRNRGLDLVGATVGGDPVDPTAEYRVAAPTFAFHSELFAPLSPDRKAGGHGSQHDALANYVRHRGFPDGVEGRATAVFDRSPDATHSL